MDRKYIIKFRQKQTVLKVAYQKHSICRNIYLFEYKNGKTLDQILHLLEYDLNNSEFINVRVNAKESIDMIFEYKQKLRNDKINNLINE